MSRARYRGGPAPAAPGTSACGGCARLKWHRRGQWWRLPGCAEQVLDPLEAAGEVGDVGFGCALLALLEGEHQLAPGLEAPAANLGDAIGALEVHGGVQLAAPHAQAPQRPVYGVPVADHVSRAAVEGPRGPSAGA